MLTLVAAEITEAERALAMRIHYRAPVHVLRGPEIETAVGRDTTVFAKLELLQHTGAFKARDALLNASALVTQRAAQHPGDQRRQSCDACVSRRANRYARESRHDRDGQSIAYQLCQAFGAGSRLAPDARGISRACKRSKRKGAR